MPGDKTHREVKKPKMAIRYLAEYMNASDRLRRSILRECKFPKIARLIQHDEAKMAIANFIIDGSDISELVTRADQIRNRLWDNEYNKDLNDHNADYITRFCAVYDRKCLPEAEILPAGKKLTVSLGGTALGAELQFRLRRLTKTNRVRVGGGMLRYAKGKPLATSVGEWQSAILFGLLTLPDMIDETGAETEQKLCITLDAQSGKMHAAPTNSVSRFKNAEAACATIADIWRQIEPPPGAVL